MSHEKDITRKRLSLDGKWQFRHENGPWRVRVPGVWQAQFDDLRFHGGSAIYRRRFVIPK